MGKKRVFAVLLSTVLIVTVLLLGMAAAYAEGKLTAPVTKLVINASSGKPTLTWDEVKGAAKYEVYRATGKNGSFTRMKTQESEKYTNTSAVPGKTYYYKVRAVDAKGNKGAFSKTKYITCDCARPVVTAGVKMSTGKPRLTWKSIDGASKYEVYRATSKSGTYKRIYTTTGTSFTNTSAVEGKTYYYKVKAICGASSYGNSAFSSVKSVACSDPTINITLTINAKTGKPQLKWNEIAGAEKYEVYSAIGKNGSFTRLITTKSAKVTNTSAIPGKTYYYKVRAVDAEGNKSAYSKTKYITCDCARPNVAIELNGTTGKPRLTWAAVDGASKYEVYRATSKDGIYAKFYTATGTKFTNTSAVEGKTYYYKVKALCGASSYGDSAFSEVSSIVCGSAADDGVLGTAVCTANDWMNLRSGPGTSYAKSGQFKTGQKANVYAIQDNWYKLKIDGAYHWASGDYLDVTLKNALESGDKYSEFPVVKNNLLAGKVIILDPGHGIGGGGAYADYTEHIYNLKHAKLIRESLENSGATVIMTRTNDTHVDNYARVSMANKYTLELLKKDRQKDLKNLPDDASQQERGDLEAEIKELDRLIGVMQSVIDDPKLADTYYLSPYDSAVGRAVHKDLKKIFDYQKDPILNHVIYVSIHSNATGNGSTSTNGTVTFYMDNDFNDKYYTGYQTAKNKLLATELCDEVVAAAGFAKRGVKVNDYFMVREVNIPSALLEIGFHTNAKDRKKLMDPVTQKRVANAVTYAVMDYFN